MRVRCSGKRSCPTGARPDLQTRYCGKGSIGEHCLVVRARNGRKGLELGQVPCDLVRGSQIGAGWSQQEPSRVSLHGGPRFERQKNRKNKEFFRKASNWLQSSDDGRVATKQPFKQGPRLARTASLEDQFEPNFEHSRPPFVVFCRLKSPSSSRELVEMTARRSGSVASMT